MNRIRNHFTSAHAIAMVALFVALGGTSIAAVSLTKNSVGSAQVKKNSLKAADIARNAVGASEIRSNSVRGGDVGNGSIGSLDIGDNAVGGGELADNSVGSGELGDNSVGSGEVTDNGLNANDIDGATLDGEVGPDAIARVQADGTLLPKVPADNPDIPDQSKNFTQANIDRPVPAAPGVYCVRGLPRHPRSAMVASDNAGASAATDNDVVVSVAVERGNNLAPCNGVAGLPPAQARIVATEVDGSPVNVDKNFILWLEF